MWGSSCDNDALPGNQIDLDDEQVWAGLHDSDVVFRDARPLRMYWEAM